MQNKSPSPFEKGTQGLKVDKPQEKLPTRIDQNDCPVPQDSEKLPLKAMASPTPKKVQSKASMDFYKAVAEIAVNGKKVTRLEWGDPNTFCEMTDAQLRLVKNGQTNYWVVSEGDISADDWVLV